ncbi:MAG: ATP-dependent Clp protease ATP-binding subunit [Saprospiraceae bacterium]|nr:ATP-dependent Clp protease ATP-binding subunit [Saprospiraceae bacterium]
MREEREKFSFFLSSLTLLSSYHHLYIPTGNLKVPQSIALPFQTVRLRLNTGEELLFPLSDPNAIHLGTSASALAEKFANRFQEKQLNKGQHLSLLDQLNVGEFATKKITVPFTKAPDGISYPDFELEFDCIYQLRPASVWGMLPALGLETLATDETELEKQLIEVVRIEFSSKKRLQSVFQIVAASWFDSAEVINSEVKLKTWSPAELVEIQKNKQQELLPKVAERMVVEQPAAFGREEELGQMERIFKGRFSRNLLLVGASGTGKTALVQELVHRRKLLGITQEIWETTASVLIKELTNETGWQDNLSLLIKELTLKDDVLFVRNLADLFEVGRYEGNAVSVAEYLRSAVGRGEVTLISECTAEERARIELTSPGYLAFFQTVEISEPKKDVEGIILQKMKTIGGHRKVEVAPSAVAEIIRLQRRFAPYSGMPGRPIRFLEGIVLAQSEAPILPKKKKNKAEVTMERHEPATVSIGRDHVLRQFCEESGLPPFMVDPTIPMDVVQLRKSFNANVFSQGRAVETVVDMLATVKTALTRTGKPIASFLFAGPTGVGKTELAKVLAQTMFGSRERMLRFDMSEYSNPYSVMRLIGESYKTEGLLTSAVRRDPFCVLLFDEIEKADAKFYELLLQILSEGRLTDSRGRVVNFCSAIIIMTTNIGAANLHRGRISWKKELGELDVVQHFTSAIEKHFRPELYNRIDGIVAFAPLDQETMRFVVEREIDLLRKREGIRFRHVDLTISEAVLDHLAVVGYEVRFGARYLQRTIREQLSVPLAEALNEYAFDERLSVQVDLLEGKISVKLDADPLGFDLLMEQWDKLTLAEKTSHQRRKIALLLESPLFLRFQSELDMLEGDLKKTGDDFWKSGEQPKRYAALQAGQAMAKAVSAEIQELEVEIALACMGHSDFKLDFGQRLETWEAEFFVMQEQLISLIFPKRNSCHIGIYGSQLEQLHQFYLSVCEARNYEIKSMNAVWFREGYQGDNPDETEKSKPKTLHYVHLPILNPTAAKLMVQPAKPDDLFCGLELEIRGTGAWQYLKPENGLWLFSFSEIAGSNTHAMVEVVMNKIKTPDDIHRQSFYQNHKPRRLISPTGFVDNKFSLSSYAGLMDNLPAVMGKLEELYKDAVVRSFLETEEEDS